MQKRRKLSQIAVLLIFLAITVFINLIAAKLNLTVDFTENEMYSVSDTAKEITGKLNKEINAYCFVENENKTNVIMEFTDNFCKTSDKLHYRAINPTKHPEITQRYTAGGAVITDKTVVFDNGTNYRIVPYEEMFSYNYLTGQKNLLVAEEKFLIALIALNKDTLANIAFLKGHGEEFDDDLKKRFEDLGAKCADVDLMNEEISGFDVSVLISPKIDFTAEDIEKLEAFLNGGGTVLTAVDASVPKLEMYDNFLAEWGVAVERNMIFGTDNKSISGNNPYSVIGSLKSHPLTDGLIKNGIRPVFFASRGITALWEVCGGKTVAVLVETPENAAAVSLDSEEKEEAGAYALLTLSMGEKGRIFTFGSNMSFSEAVLPYNIDLIRNIIIWSIDGELPADVSPKIITGSNIQPPKTDIAFWFLMFGVIIPVLIAAVGIVVAIRRKKL